MSMNAVAAMMPLTPMIGTNATFTPSFASKFTLAPMAMSLSPFGYPGPIPVQVRRSKRVIAATDAQDFRYR